VSLCRAREDRGCMAVYLVFAGRGDEHVAEAAAAVTASKKRRRANAAAATHLPMHLLRMTDTRLLHS
jgi:hypothetical protein